MLTLVKRILYGKSYPHCYMRDMVLGFFENTDHIRNEVLYGDKPLGGLSAVIDFLSAEGMIRVSRYGVSITERGKAMSASGGYRRQLLKERIRFLGVIIAIIAGVVGIVTALFRLS